MDPLSQAVTGAALAGCFSRKATMRPALLVGALAGMAPDLDVLIRSNSDPLLMLEYHRHFTHSLAFSPIGGLICALFFYLFPWVRNRLSLGQTILFSILGLFTHGLLDACTGYGTHLLWPFSHARESWNIIGIIDPLYTLPALLLLGVAAWKRAHALSTLALLWMLAYLGLGAWQHDRAETAISHWLTRENIQYSRLTVRPTIGNLWLWRVIYKDDAANRWQTHAIYMPYWRTATDSAAILRGQSVDIYEDSELQHFPSDSAAGHDLRRFHFFSAGYLSRHTQPDGRTQIGDVRYSMLPHTTAPLWAVTEPSSPDEHVEFLRLLRGEGVEPIY